MVKKNIFWLWLMQRGICYLTLHPCFVSSVTWRTHHDHLHASFRCISYRMSNIQLRYESTTYISKLNRSARWWLLLLLSFLVKGFGRPCHYILQSATPRPCLMKFKETYLIENKTYRLNTLPRSSTVSLSFIDRVFSLVWFLLTAVLSP